MQVASTEPHADDDASHGRIVKVLAVVLGGLLLAALPVFLIRVFANRGGCDFPEYWTAGRYILDHRTRQTDSLLYRYLPSVDVAWVLFAWMPMRIAAVVFYLFTCATWAGLLATVRKHLLPDAPANVRTLAVLGAAALTMLFTLDHLMLGSFHILMVWLLLAGVMRAGKGRQVSGGLLVGAAIWLKLLPALAVPYLLLKRRWTAALLSVGFALFVDVALSLAAYGPAGAWQMHRDWFHGHAVGDLQKLLTHSQAVPDERDRNQSLAAVMRRTLSGLGAKTVGPEKQWIPHTPLRLDRRQLRFAYAAVVASALLGLAWFCRKPAAMSSPAHLAREASMVALATIWFSPIVFSYHPVAALPGIAVLLGSPHASQSLKRATVVTWILAAIGMGFMQARAIGEVLWASVLLGLALACLNQRVPTDDTDGHR